MITRIRILAAVFFLFLLAFRQAEAQKVKSIVEKEVQLNGDIQIVVEDIGILLMNNPTGRQPPLVPFLNGYAMKGSTLRYISKDTLRFTLARNSTDAASREAWNHILGGKGPRKRSYTVSVAAEGTGPIASDQPVIFDVYPSPWSQIAIVVLALLIVAFFALVFLTDILKDPNGETGKKTFSLGRFQMAWWFFIILSSFTYIWMVTGDLKMPDTSLVLMGISGATALGAVLVKSNPKKPDAERAKTTVKHFLTDLLGNDKDPITLHRFQMFAWTLILGVIFIAGVFKELAQPILDSSLLTLMGISSGTYVGFKFPEKS